MYAPRPMCLEICHLQLACDSEWCAQTLSLFGAREVPLPARVVQFQRVLRLLRPGLPVRLLMLGLRGARARTCVDARVPPGWRTVHVCYAFRSWQSMHFWSTRQRKTRCLRRCAAGGELAVRFVSPRGAK